MGKGEDTGGLERIIKKKETTVNVISAEESPY